MPRTPVLVNGQVFVVDRQRLIAAQGDPFLGGLIAGIGKLAFKGIKALVGKIRGPGTAGLITQGKAPFSVAKSLARVGPGTAGVAAGIAGGFLAQEAATFAVDAFGNRIRKRRRMNVTNVKALRRSMRRVQGFACMAEKTIDFTKRVKMRKRKRTC